MYRLRYISIVKEDLDLNKHTLSHKYELVKDDKTVACFEEGQDEVANLTLNLLNETHKCQQD